MLKQNRTAAVFWLCLAVTPSLNAGTIAEWNFDDAPGTSLKSAANGGAAGGAWMHNFDKTTTDGSGKLVSTKPSGGIWNTYWAIPTDAPRKLWLSVDLSSWHLAGAKVKEALRAGFSTSDDDNKPQVVAQFIFERLPNAMVVRGDALGDGATSVSGDGMSFQSTGTSPATLVVGLDQDAGTYSVGMRTAGGVKQLGKGKTSPGRPAKYIRFSIAGDLTDTEEQISVDRIAVTDTDPLAN